MRLVEWIHMVFIRNQFNMSDELLAVAERADVRLREEVHRRAAERGTDIRKPDGTWKECGEREEGVVVGREMMEGILQSLMAQASGISVLNDEQLELLRTSTLEHFDTLVSRVWDGKSVWGEDCERTPDPWDYQDNCEFLAEVFMFVLRQCWTQTKTAVTMEDGTVEWRDRPPSERPLVTMSPF